jgi:GNAT superfamily N-acetyltransferase
MIAVRTAGLPELNDLIPLFDDYRVFYGQVSDRAGAEKFLSERLQLNDSVIFMAFEGEAALGFTQLYPIFTSVGMKRSWLLNDLFVTPAARKKGIATLLLERAKKHGRDSASGWLLLSTGVANTSAQSLYENNGWQRVNDFYYEFVF